MPTVASGSPSESRKGTTVYPEHSGRKVIVRATKVSFRRSNGVHYETIGQWCPFCGFQPNDTGKRIQLETLEGLLQA